MNAADPGKYDYRQDLAEVALSLLRDLVVFLQEHPEAVPVLIGAYLKARELLATATQK